MTYPDGSIETELVPFEWVEVDSKPPEAFSITSPTASEITPTSFDITWTKANDESPVKYEIKILDSSCSTEVLRDEVDGVLSYNVSNGNLSPATNYCLKLKATDSNSFYTEASNNPIYFTTDVVNITTSTSKRAELSDDYLNATEQASGNALVNPPVGSYDKVYYSMKTGVHATCDLAFAGYTETVPSASDVTTEGSYTICSYVTDTAETIRDYEPNPITFEYDATAPTVVTALNITEPARYKGSSITANWTLSVDGTANILKQTVQLYKGLIFMYNTIWCCDRSSKLKL